MPSMKKLVSGIKVAELLEQIEANPSLWNRYRLRTETYENSPHREVDDIFIRYRDYSELDPEHPERFSDEHESVYYAAYHELPALKPLIDNIFTLVNGLDLGGVLITRIPAGKQVYPHQDAGWHVNHYASKFLLLLKSAPGQHFDFEDESHEGEAGDLFMFDNRPLHGVMNTSDTDRISLLLAIRQKDINE